MKSCLSDLYRKVSAQIRREMKIKEAENKLKLYKYYIPLIVNSISESINVDPSDLAMEFTRIAERRAGIDLIQSSNSGKETEVNSNNSVNGKETTSSTQIDSKKYKEQITLDTFKP